jgi:hypothetical protein
VHSDNKDTDNFITNFYPWAKRELIEAEAFSGFYDVELWMNVRNGLDDFLTCLYFFKQDKTDAGKQNLDESYVHLRTSVHSAWIRAASKKIENLETMLQASRVRGNIEIARTKLLEAKKMAKESRTLYSTEYDKAVELAKKSANTANDGLALIRIEDQSSLYAIIPGAIFVGLIAAVIAGPIAAIIGGGVGAFIGYLVGK